MSGERLYEIFLADSFQWIDTRDSDSIHAIVTDPPYGLKEYTEKEQGKLRKRRGGVWRIPPSFDGRQRSPLPRFTVLSDEDKEALQRFFVDFARKAMRVLVPGAHVFIATNPLLSHLVYGPMLKAGFEKRAEIIRLVQRCGVGTVPRTRTMSSLRLPLCRVPVGNLGVCFANPAKAEFKIICENGKLAVLGDYHRANLLQTLLSPHQPGQKNANSLPTRR